MSNVQPSVSRLLVVANGECDQATLLRCQAKAPDKIICVDGGLRHCLEASLVPDVLLGDFDSATQALLERLDPSRTRLVDFPVEKDATDLELALQYANSEFVQTESEHRESVDTDSTNTLPSGSEAVQIEVMLAGLSGGRTDHMLANWMLLANPEWRFRITVFDALGIAYLVTAATSRSVSLDPGATFSLLPLTTARGVTVEGAKYPLSKATLYPYRSRGISNIANAATGSTNKSGLTVSISDGFVLLYVNNNEAMR